VVVVLTISAGHSAEYLLGAVAAGRENYYTGAVAAGEPPGRWYGRGAESLGLSGLVDGQDMTALYEHFLDPRDDAFRDPEQWDECATLGHAGRRYLSEEELYTRAIEREPDASAERRAELRLDASKSARHNVGFLDATFNVQKSITVLHAAFEAQEVNARTVGDEQAAAAWGAHRQAVEDAIWAGNRAALDYLAEKAGYSRVGHHGGAAGRYIDAHDWTIASFFQHDNRDHAPHLHIHNTILNRVQAPDGQWRTLDSRAVHKFRGAASAVGERTTEETLAHSLGVLAATRPDGKARELLGIAAEVRELFSPRRHAVTHKTADLVSAFEARFGCAPNALQLDRLSRQATSATRQAKSHTGESTEARLERWDRELRAEVDGGLAQVAHEVLALAGQRPTPQEWSPAAVIATALAEVQDRKAGWTPPDLTRAISNALPDHLGIPDGAQIADLVDRLTAEALPLVVPLTPERPGEDTLPPEVRLADGRSPYEAPGGRLYATPEHVHTERLLLTATTPRDGARVGPAAAQRFIAGLAETGIELGADQAAAVHGVLTSGVRLESLIGPAGTGKSFVVGALAKAWQDPAHWPAPTTDENGDDGDSRPGDTGRAPRVFGLAASQIATQVLTAEGLTARNITRWLATQARLTTGRTCGDDLSWRLHAGDLVVVDESAMADTAALAAVHARVAEAGGKLLLVGDHRQLAAVGAGGGMDLLATTGTSYELADARRFREPWERDASLRLRTGDQTVLAEYHRHGRLVDGGAAEQAEASAARAWLADTLAGHRSLLLVDDNQQAARLSAAQRADLVRLGRVDEAGVPLGLQGTYAGVGDLVQARRNGWELAGYAGNRRGPINRETYRVLTTHPDGGLVVAPVIGPGPDGTELHGDRMTLPESYVAEHVALGYASTVHAAQGVTVDTSHTVITPNTGPDALYVGLSRGRASNTAHVVTRAVPADAPTGAVNDAIHRTPAAVLATTMETAEPELSALATATQAAAENEAIRTPAELLADACELATAGRTAGWLDALTATGALTAEQRSRIAAEDGTRTLGRTLRRAELAGHDPRTVLRAAVTERPLHDARQLTNVIHHRITDSWPLDPVGDSYADWTPQVADPQWQAHLEDLAATADARRDELGRATLVEAPPWAVEAFGAPPDDSEEREAWSRRAAAVAAHRELTEHDDPAQALGPAPKPGQVEAYASWRSAWRALGRRDADRDDLELSDGQLRIRVRAATREWAWAPRHVANERAGMTLAADTHRRNATLRAAEAANETDPARRAEIEQQAAEAAALADTLDQHTAELATADEARGTWLAHTAATRAAADRAAAELAARGIDANAPDDTVTAAEWLAAQRTAEAAEDPHRQVANAAELADTTTTARDRDRDQATYRWPVVPAEQWHAAHTEHQVAEDPHRTITDEAEFTDVTEQRIADLDAVTTGAPEPPGLERAAPSELTLTHAEAGPAESDPVEVTDEAELTDVAEQRAADLAAVADVDPVPPAYLASPVAEDDQAPTPTVTDLRDTAADEPAPIAEDYVRVPTPDETADSVQRAQRALHEITARQAAEDRQAVEERSQQLTRWHATDQAADQERDHAVDRDAATIGAGGSNADE